MFDVIRSYDTILRMYHIIEDHLDAFLRMFDVIQLYNTFLRLYHILEDHLDVVICATGSKKVAFVTVEL